MIFETKMIFLVDMKPNFKKKIFREPKHFLRTKKSKMFEKKKKILEDQISISVRKNFENQSIFVEKNF